VAPELVMGAREKDTSLHGHQPDGRYAALSKQTKHMKSFLTVERSKDERRVCSNVADIEVNDAIWHMLFYQSDIKLQY